MVVADMCVQNLLEIINYSLKITADNLTVTLCMMILSKNFGGCRMCTCVFDRILSFILAHNNATPVIIYIPYSTVPNGSSNVNFKGLEQMSC